VVNERSRAQLASQRPNPKKIGEKKKRKSPVLSAIEASAKAVKGKEVHDELEQPWKKSISRGIIERIDTEIAKRSHKSIRSKTCCLWRESRRGAGARDDQKAAWLGRKNTGKRRGRVRESQGIGEALKGEGTECSQL